MPTYNSYVKKAAYQDIISASQVVQLQVAKCINEVGPTTNVKPGPCPDLPFAAVEIPAGNSGLSFTLKVTEGSGVITATPTGTLPYGITEADTYELTPATTDIGSAPGNGVIKWGVGGGCVTSKLCK